VTNPLVTLYICRFTHPNVAKPSKRTNNALPDRDQRAA
jgi:hypothetical protein